MVLLLGSKDDAFTSYVAEWLSYLNQDYIVFLGEENVKVISFNKQKSELMIKYHNREINLFEIDSVLSRRSGLKSINYTTSNEIPNLSIEANDLSVFHVNQEALKMTEYIHFILRRNCKKIIGGFNHNVVNKLIVLEFAKEIGFNIPIYSILSTKRDLFKFYTDAKREGQNIITKPMAEGVYAFSENFGYYSYVERVKENDFKSIPDKFFPSFFQVEIKKKYEIRVFYLSGRCYSMVILSQDSVYTETDFRKPILNNSLNRKLPYVLPKSIEDKITLLMDKLLLNTGSIDLIVDSENEYYFLEVNPVGQVLMTSVPCNYYLDKLVALSLINN